MSESPDLAIGQTIGSAVNQFVRAYPVVPVIPQAKGQDIASFVQLLLQEGINLGDTSLTSGDGWIIL